MDGIVPEIVDFVRIAGEVEKLAERFVEKVDQFPLRCAHHCHVVGRQETIAAVFGKDGVSSLPGPSLQGWQQRSGFEFIRDVQSRQLEDGRAEIEEGTELVQRAARSETAGRPDDRGHARDGIVHRPLLAVAVITEAVAVIGG